MKRFHISLTVRELDVSEEDAMGASLSEEVDVMGIFDLFNRWRDAVGALFGTPSPMVPKRATTGPVDNGMFNVQSNRDFWRRRRL